jgi:hypothetical protein
MPSGLILGAGKDDCAGVFSGSRGVVLACDSRNPPKDICAYFRDLFAFPFSFDPFL